MENISLREFLKKYSNIHNDFIDDFFDMYEIETNEKSFVINLDKISDWLDVSKGNLKDTLINSYKKNIDYKIKKNPTSDGSGGKNRELIMLTPRCFKKLCMLSKSKKAEEVREYFLEVEELLDKYKIYTIQALRKRIQTLEYNQKTKYKSSNGVIYIFRASEEIDSLYKIGRTKNLDIRLKNYNTSNADDLKLEYVYETDNINEVENCLKSLIKKFRYRKYKEVYQIDINVLKKLIDGCSKLSLKTNLHHLKNKKITGGYYIALYEQ